MLDREVRKTSEMGDLRQCACSGEVARLVSGVVLLQMTSSVFGVCFRTYMMSETRLRCRCDEIGRRRSSVEAQFGAGKLSIVAARLERATARCFCCTNGR